MKTKLIYIGLILLMNSCLAVRAPQVYLGMSESEFRDKAKYEEINIEITKIEKIFYEQGMRL